ncbi:MAG: tyrosine-protein phosphatase [Solobacterium sp.]|nr:tyrosine-protein phosphatase [Solobacterium sp.]
MSGIRKELNFRDLGGYPSKDGRTVRHGIFYRSAGLFRMNEEEIAQIESLNIKAIMDLRADWQRKKRPDPEIRGAKQIEHTGFVPESGREIDFSPRGMHQIGEDARNQFEKLELYYRDLIFRNPDFQIFMDNILAGNVPIIFHCASGKDRTGAAAILLLLALGVDEKVIMEDYLLTNKYYEDMISDVFGKMYDEVISDDYLPVLLQIENGVMEYIGRAMLEEIRNRYETTEAFLEQEYGLDRKKLEKLRNDYLE